VHVVSTSAQVSRTRPFYAGHAEAYDLLVTDPVEPWVEAVHDRLVAQGWSSAQVLDAGCGTGRHAAALAAKGHHVDLADASARLLAQAAARNPSARALRVDLCTFATETAYQAVMCRGVLNDMTTDTERDAVLRAFADALTDGGFLFLDVREAEGARQRADGIPRHRTVDLGALGVLRYTSTVTWQAGQIHVLEDSELRRPDTPTDHHVFEFTMRPWSTRELRERLGAAGFNHIDIGPGVGRVTGDRLFVTARPAATTRPVT
jgi:SAM-dependent methyltransferase